MQKLTMQKFINGDYTEKGESLYMVRDGETLLYIGISKANIANRWLGYRGHVYRNHNGELTGTSTIGQVVADNMPESLTWTMELWTVNDCIAYLDDKTPKSRELESLERSLIQELTPLFNTVHNRTPQSTEKYLRNSQDLTSAPCDYLGLRL